MAQKVFNLPERTTSTQTHTITVPNLKKIVSVTSNRGIVSVESVNGNEVTLRVSGGSYTRQVQTGGSYTASHTKEVSTTRSKSESDYNLDVSLGKESFPSSVSYNSDGYTGTLPFIKLVDNGALIIALYTGNVTKPASDTRTYTYYYQYDVTINYEDNAAPTVTVDTPTSNKTLYENDTLNIAGSVTDTDVNNSVTVRYQINAETVRAIDAFISTGSAESFSKQLTFRGGNLYDGDTLIAEDLADGTAHTLKVYATDDQGGQSSITEIPFYVVPNRAPSLTVKPPVTAGSIDNDEIEITGSYDDLDKNTSVVSYRINGGNSVQVTSGTNGTFDFKIKLGQLKVGLNNIVVEVIDSHGAKTSSTVKLQKNEIKTEQLKSTARYKINPPTGSAQAVLLWIQRDEKLDMDVSISMTMQGEAESFTPLTASNSAPIEQDSTITEDEFYHEADSAKDTIIVQIDMTRESIDASDKIHLISGVLE